GLAGDADNPAFTNYGTVTVNSPTLTAAVNAPFVNAAGATVNVSAGSFSLARGGSNQGTITASGGATLQLAGPIANAGGSITSPNTKLFGATIDQGAFSTPNLTVLTPSHFTDGVTVALDGGVATLQGDLDLSGATLATPGSLTLRRLTGNGLIVT